MDLVALVKEQFGGDMVSRIAAAVGVETSSAKTAIDAGLPAMLAGLTGVASSGDGARRLAMAVEGTDDRATTNFGEMISSGARGVMESGGNVLNSLFGSGTVSSINGVVSRFTGVGTGGTSGVIAIITPVVMGVLKGKKEEEHLDAGGLATMLEGQKGNIARAMPKGFGNMLASSVPGLGGMTEWARSAVGQPGVGTTRGTAKVAKSKGSRWVVPVVLVVAIAALVWWMAGRSGRVAPTMSPYGGAAVSPTRVKSEVVSVLQSATDTLAGVRDPASADAAVAKLGALSAKMDDSKQVLATLPAGERAPIVSAAKEGSTGLMNQVDRVKGIPGISDEAKRVVSDLALKANSLGM